MKRAGTPSGLAALATSLVLLPLLLNGCRALENPVNYSGPAQIEYTIAGGIGGIQLRTTIQEDGWCELTGWQGNDISVMYLLEDNQLQELKARFALADFIHLKDAYRTKTPIMDGFVYSITYRTDGRTKTVFAEDGARYPGKLQQLLQVLYELNWQILSADTPSED